MFGNEKYPQDHIAIIRATSGLYYIYVSNLDFSKVQEINLPSWTYYKRN